MAFSLKLGKKFGMKLLWFSGCWSCFLYVHLIMYFFFFFFYRNSGPFDLAWFEGPSKHIDGGTFTEISFIDLLLGIFYMLYSWISFAKKLYLYVHKIFRYSIWLDSKLRLQLDPLLILEYFLWRKGYEFAISNHYDRHCVWEEVAQNKKLNKYNHTIIDQQFQFYQDDGLTRFNASDPNKLLPSSMILFNSHFPP